MDTSALRNAVFEKTGRRIEADDPIFAIVALNEALLEQMLAQYGEASSKSAADLLRKLDLLADLTNKLLDAAQQLTGRVDDVHMIAALKAATAQKDQIDSATRKAISEHFGKLQETHLQTAQVLSTLLEQTGASKPRQTARLIVICMTSGLISALVTHFLPSIVGHFI